MDFTILSLLLPIVPTIVRHHLMSFFFADDSALDASGYCESELRLNLKRLFDRVILWFDPNYLTLNFSKSSLLFFRVLSRDLSLVI